MAAFEVLLCFGDMYMYIQINKYTQDYELKVYKYNSNYGQPNILEPMVKYQAECSCSYYTVKFEDTFRNCDSIISFQCKGCQTVLRIQRISNHASIFGRTLFVRNVVQLDDLIACVKTQYTFSSGHLRRYSALCTNTNPCKLRQMYPFKSYYKSYYSSCNVV